MIVLTKKPKKQTQNTHTKKKTKADNENNKHMNINKQVKVGWVELYDPPICGIAGYWWTKHQNGP